MKNPVPERIAGERTKKLRKLSDLNYLRYAGRWIGCEVDVLLEEKNGEIWTGTSGNYLKSEVCDIINKEDEICRAVIKDVSVSGVRCSFKDWL